MSWVLAEFKQSRFEDIQRWRSKDSASMDRTRESCSEGGMTKSLDVIRVQVTSNRVFGEERRNISSVKDEEKRTKNGALRNTELDLNPGRSSVAKDDPLSATRKIGAEPAKRGSMKTTSQFKSSKQDLYATNVDSMRAQGASIRAIVANYDEDKKSKTVAEVLKLIEFIHSFIVEHLYSTPSRKLLRGAPNSSTAKKNSLKVRKEYRREGPGKEVKLQREAIPGRGAHHRERAVLSSGGTGKRDKDDTLFG